MGKDPSAVVLATALAFCVFCPFFARCDEIELDIKKGIESLSKVQVKYQAEFDMKVKFAQLQEVIYEIDIAMMGYMGKAKDKLPRIRSLNSEARLTYRNCVVSVFVWCQTNNGAFDIFIDNIGDSNLSEMDRNIIWNLTVSTLEWGLEKTGKSLEFLTYFRKSIKELENAVRDISHYVHDDFGPGGFYSEQKVDLQKRINGSSLDRHLPVIFTVIFNWKQKQTYKAQIEFIEHLFTVLTKKIENVTKKVKEMESDLKVDKTNLQKLQRVIAGPNNKKEILLSDMALRRVQFIPNIQNLKDSCAKYVNWHGFNDPFCQKNRFRTRRTASTFYESEPSPA